MSPCVSRSFAPVLAHATTDSPTTTLPGRRDGDGRDAEEQPLELVDDGHRMTDHRTRLLLWELVMEGDDGKLSAPWWLHPFPHSTDAKSQRPSCSMLLALLPSLPDPARISTSRAHGRVSLPQPGTARRCSCFLWASTADGSLDRGAGQLRLAAATAGIGAVLASADPYTAPRSRQLHGLPLVLIAGSQPLLLHATRQTRLRFLQNACCHDKRQLLCWRPLPRGFPPPQTAPGLDCPNL